jgi:hypothetical protein
LSLSLSPLPIDGVRDVVHHLRRSLCR